jgi:hypothetical protein
MNMNGMNHEFEFSGEQMTEMAAFVSELVRQGVTYRVFNLIEGCGCWRIELLGGF